MAKHPSTIPAPSRTDALTNGVLEGMRKHPRQLSPVWFYDELGSFLFDSICELPEYYLTRTESQIMQQHAADMAHHIGPDGRLLFQRLPEIAQIAGDLFICEWHGSFSG